MNEVNRSNACEILTKEIINRCKEGLETLTAKNMNWETAFKPLINNEAQEAKKHMEQLGKALSAEVTDDLSELIDRTKNIEDAIEKNLRYSNTWKRLNAFSSTFFGTYTPKLWAASFDQIRASIKQAESELKKKLQENKRNQKKEKEADINKQSPGGSFLHRSTSAPLPAPHANSVPPAPPLPSAQLIPSSGSPLPPPPPPPPSPPQSSERKEIQQLISKFNKEAQNLSKEERERRIKEIKEKAKKASNKYFGENTPITLKVLRKPDVKKAITKISKRTNKEKDFFWPLLLGKESLYRDLLKQREAWQKASHELKVQHQDLYQQGLINNGENLRGTEYDKYDILTDKVNSARKEFINKLQNLHNSGVSTYNQMKNFKVIKIKTQKLWYEGKHDWIKKYLAAEDKKKEDFKNNLKTFLKLEQLKFENFENLKKLKEAYEKTYAHYKIWGDKLKTVNDDINNINNTIDKKEEEIQQLTLIQQDPTVKPSRRATIKTRINNIRKDIDKEKDKLETIRKEVKKTKTFNKIKKVTDRKYDKIKKLIEGYETQPDTKLRLTNDEKIISKINVGLANNPTTSLDVILRLLLKDNKLEICKTPQELQKLLEDVMNGTCKNKIEKLETSSL